MRKQLEKNKSALQESGSEKERIVLSVSKKR